MVKTLTAPVEIPAPTAWSRRYPWQAYEAWKRNLPRNLSPREYEEACRAYMEVHEL